MNKLKTRFISVAALVFYTLSGLSFTATADAAKYPIDTTPSGVHSFESIEGTSLPTTHALKDIDGAKNEVELKVISQKRNRLLKLTQTPGSSTAYQARIQSQLKPDFGNIELEFDFMVEDTNGSSDATFPDRRIMMAENFMSGFYFLNLWTDAYWENPYIQTTYKNSSNANKDIKFSMAYELDKWYNFKAYINPSKGCFTLILTNEAGNQEKIAVTDALPVNSFGNLQLIRISQWSGYTNPNCASTVVYFDNVTMKTTPDISLKNVSPSNASSAYSPSAEISFDIGGEISGMPTVKLDDTAVPSSALSINSDGSFTHKPSVPFEWATSHSIKISAVDKAGASYNFDTINFTIMTQPQNLIEVLGFYDANGKINNLKQGEITAKLRFWQKETQTYTYVVGLYEKTAETIKLVSANCGSFTANAKTDKNIPIIVPSDFENCYIKVFVFDSFTNRKLFYGSEISGETVLN